MLDTVVTLKADKSASPTILPALAPQPEPIPPVRFKVRISALASQGQCRVRLWNPSGRKPKPVGTDWDFYGRTDMAVEMAGSLEEIQGATLTWSIRLAPFQPDAGERYELLAQVVQWDEHLKKDVVTPNADFRYSGPLDDYEEVTGRFHFSITSPDPWLSQSASP